MSGAVDVLADLQGVVRIAKAASLGVAGNKPRIERAEQAIAAFAELIERARALRSAHCAFQDWKAKAPERYPAPRSILEMNVHAKAMLFAALDRVGAK
jgi:hypothetical protein